MKLSFVQILAGGVGALLVYSAIANKTPVAVIKEAFGKAQAQAPLGPYKRPADMPVPTSSDPNRGFGRIRAI